MKSKYSLLLLLLFGFLSGIYSQTYGPELITNGDFGTTKDGKNGDDLAKSQHIYYQLITDNNTWPPTVTGAKPIPSDNSYFQPFQQVNPGVSIGYPLFEQSSYLWGLSEFYSAYATVQFPGTSIQVPNNPPNGSYVIATSTKGMYTSDWALVYDKHEVNTDAPTNYFMIVNADRDLSKIFLYETIDVTPGQTYRISADLFNLNHRGIAPDVSFIITSNKADLENDVPKFSTGDVPSNNEWNNYTYDYVVPCGVTRIYMAFRNNKAGGEQNDLALDNLSVKSIHPQIKADINYTNNLCEDGVKFDLSFDFSAFQETTNSVSIIIDPNNTWKGSLTSTTTIEYYFQWEYKNASGIYTKLGTASKTYQNLQGVQTPGIYRLCINTTVTTVTTGPQGISDPRIGTSSYSTLDSDCEIYSNEIEVVLVNGCPTVLTPTAIDDNFQVLKNETLTGNVLSNDIASDGTNSGISVSSYIISASIGNQTIAAGQTNLIYDPTSDTLMGSIRINQDGSFIFNPALDFIGTIPPIKYLVYEEGAGESSANLNIKVVEELVDPIEVNIDASCSMCPIQVTVTGLNPSADNKYGLYKRNVKVADITSSTFTFSEDKAGEYTYQIKNASNNVVKDYIVVTVHPSTAIWTPSGTEESTWQKTENWTTDGDQKGYPIWCTDVIIGSNQQSYPIVVDNDACRDITFKDGATVGQVHKLSYRRAFVEFTPKRDKWTMLSAPLKYTYSADFQSDPTWGETAGIDPRIYMRYFDVRYAEEGKSITNPDGKSGASIGGFSNAFADLKERLNSTFGFVLNVSEGSNDAFNGTFKFPRLNADGSEVLFKYHYTQSGKWVDTHSNAKYLPFRFTDSGEGGRGTQANPTDQEWINLHLANNKYNTRGISSDNNHRFVYEEIGKSKINLFDVNIANIGTTNIIGNPFMSHIDFEKFYETNSDKIQAYYRIWDGNSFYSYVLTGNDTGAWTGLTDITNIDAGSKLIAPMQAFFVEMVGNAQKVTFDADKISTAAAGANTKLRSAQSNNNLVKVTLEMDEIRSSTIVASLNSASDKYDAKEDVSKLFSFDESTPEIYSISDGVAIEINAIGASEDNKTIPLGIKTSKVGSFKLSFAGANNFDAYEDIQLKDAAENKLYDLKINKELVFEKKTASNIESRFYMLLRSSLSSISNPEADKQTINVSSKNGIVQVISSLPINKIEVYNSTGAILRKISDLNTTQHEFSLSGESGIFILKVETDGLTKTTKINL